MRIGETEETEEIEEVEEVEETLRTKIDVSIVRNYDLYE